MFYITGDTHRDFERIELFCMENNTTKEDVLIVLGDAGINYFGGIKDWSLKNIILINFLSSYFVFRETMNRDLLI